MTGRFRYAVRDAWAALTSARRAIRPERGSGREVISGTTGNVIVVKSPNAAYFKEAIFILCDDPFTRRGVSAQELLQEARRAAAEYVGERVPQRTTFYLTHLLAFLLGALCACALLLLFGI